MNKSPKSVLVIGASDNPARTSYTALQMLAGREYTTTAVGNRIGEVAGIPIMESVEFGIYDTITLYISPTNQQPYIKILSEILKPRRVIFNPGTENPELYAILDSQGIEIVEACTLVLLRTGQF